MIGGYFGSGLPWREGRNMAAIRRTRRLVAVAALLATAGVALGFVAALARARPKSRYAASEGR
jgi:hypothetical protein